MESAYLKIFIAAVVEKKLACLVDEAKAFTKGLVAKIFLIIINYEDYSNS